MEHAVSAISGHRPGQRVRWRSVVCALDGTPTSIEAARQAAELAGPGATLHLIAISEETAPGGTPDAVTDRWRADRALSEARAVATGSGVALTSSELPADDPVPVLLARSAAADLLALGAQGRSQAGDAPLGATATALLSRSVCSLLVARRQTRALGDSLLVAVDASPSCLAAAEVAGEQAVRRGGRVAIVADPSHGPETRQVLAAVIVRLHELTGEDPVVLDENAPAERAVAAAAHAIDATLIVTGSRGADAPDSVSLRIARTAPCSVLVVRAPAPS